MLLAEKICDFILKLLLLRLLSLCRLNALGRAPIIAASGSDQAHHRTPWAGALTTLRGLRDMDALHVFRRNAFGVRSETQRVQRLK